MPTVPARLRFGFRATAYYYTQSDPYRKQIRETQAIAEIDSVLPASDRDSIRDSVFTHSDPLSEIEVHDHIQSLVSMVSLSVQAGTVQDIVYVWEGGVRYCMHSYTLTNLFLPWTFFDPQGDGYYEVIAHLRF